MDLYLLALGYSERDSHDKRKADWSSTRLFLGVLAFRKFKTSLMESKCGLIVRNIPIMIDYRFKSYGLFLNWSRYFINWTSFRSITYRSKFMQMLSCITIKLKVRLRHSVKKSIFIVQTLFNDFGLVRAVEEHATHYQYPCACSMLPVDVYHGYKTQTAQLDHVSFVVYLFLRLPVFVFLVLSEFLFFLPLNITVTEN